MATYDLEEQEQIESFKAWWARYGTWVIAAVTVFIVAVAGVRGWQWWQTKQAQESATLFERAVQARAGNDAKAVKQLTAQIMENYAQSGYATPAAWMAGQVNLEANDTQSALLQFQYAYDHARGDVLKDLARLRLATLTFSAGNPDAALTLLETTPGKPYAGLHAQLRGDILVSLKRLAEARLAWQQALDAMDKTDPLYALIEMKLDALGEAS